MAEAQQTQITRGKLGRFLTRRKAKKGGQPAVVAVGTRADLSVVCADGTTRKISVQIVDCDADPAHMVICRTAPLARAIMGLEAGDECEALPRDLVNYSKVKVVRVEEA